VIAPCQVEERVELELCQALDVLPGDACGGLLGSTQLDEHVVPIRDPRRVRLPATTLR
jgi:hypothetical protein